jgi:N utilization substance protein A
MPKENYHRGDRIRALILEVRQDGRGPQIVLSRTHTTFLVNLFKTEVPEISEGIVSIMGASREPGSRAKIAVSSNDSDIDPVGACVGMKGSRVQNVVQELKGEKIDIIPWHLDAAKFVCNALAPAEISRVIIDEDNKSMEVIVPDEALSMAIGKRGQNVRLASKLTGWHLDVKSESKYSEAMKHGYESLISLSGIGLSMADVLYERGLYSAEELAKASVKDLMQVAKITEEQARHLIEEAKNYTEKIKSLSQTENDEQTGVESVSDEKEKSGFVEQEEVEEQTKDDTQITKAIPVSLSKQERDGENYSEDIEISKMTREDIGDDES